MNTLMKAVRALDAEWNEADHPRKANGQFGKGGGTKSSKRMPKVYLAKGDLFSTKKLTPEEYDRFNYIIKGDLFDFDDDGIDYAEYLFGPGNHVNLKNFCKKVGIDPMALAKDKYNFDVVKNGLKRAHEAINAQMPYDLARDLRNYERFKYEMSGPHDLQDFMGRFLNSD